MIHNETQRMLNVRIQELKEIIEKATEELEQTEKALDATFNVVKQRKIFYVPDSTFRQKIFYCLNLKKQLLSVKEMVAMLTDVDKRLAENVPNTAKAVRTQIRRLLKEGMIVEHKSDKMKNIHYALTGWLDSQRKVKEQFMP